MKYAAVLLALLPALLLLFPAPHAQSPSVQQLSFAFSPDYTGYAWVNYTTYVTEEQGREFYTVPYHHNVTVYSSAVFNNIYLPVFITVRVYSSPPGASVLGLRFSEGTNSLQYSYHDSGDAAYLNFTGGSTTTDPVAVTAFMHDPGFTYYPVHIVTRGLNDSALIALDLNDTMSVVSGSYTGDYNLSAPVDDNISYSVEEVQGRYGSYAFFYQLSFSIPNGSGWVNLTGPLWINLSYQIQGFPVFAVDFIGGGYNPRVGMEVFYSGRLLYSYTGDQDTVYYASGVPVNSNVTISFSLPPLYGVSYYLYFSPNNTYLPLSPGVHNFTLDVDTGIALVVSVPVNQPVHISPYRQLAEALAVFGGILFAVALILLVFSVFDIASGSAEGYDRIKVLVVFSFLFFVVFMTGLYLYIY